MDETPLPNDGEHPTGLTKYCGSQLTAPSFISEVLCGITISLALVPEAIGFSFVAKVTPGIALTAAWIICTVTALAGGRPGMISAATGAIAAVVGELVQEHGVEHLFYAVMLMGLIQIGLGALRADGLIRLLPYPVMTGFCNGLALVIFRGQLDSFKQPGTEDFISGSQALLSAAICAVAFLLSMFFSKITTKIPSSLVAVVTASVIEWAVVRPCGYKTLVLSDLASVKGSLPLPVWFNSEYRMPGLNYGTFMAILPTSIIMALIGLIESLLTLSLVDEITQTRGNTRMECFGQGLANVICGVFGGMGGCAMIGQSMINILSGGRTRLSQLVAGLFLLGMLLTLSDLLGKVPISGLAGVMFTVCVLTFEWRSLNVLLCTLLPATVYNRFSSNSHLQVRLADAFVILMVTGLTLIFNLATAVIVGVLFSAVAFVQDVGPTITCVAEFERDDSGIVLRKIYNVRGNLFFGSRVAFLEQFDAQADPREVVLRLHEAMVSDLSALEAINTLGERYGNLGKTLTVERVDDTSSRQLLGRAKGLILPVVRFKVRSSVPGHSDSENDTAGGGGRSSSSPSRASRPSRPREMRQSVSPGTPVRPSLLGWWFWLCQGPKHKPELSSRPKAP
jgi:SulP family sulfate permease